MVLDVFKSVDANAFALSIIHRPKSIKENNQQDILFMKIDEKMECSFCYIASRLHRLCCHKCAIIVYLWQHLSVTSRLILIVIDYKRERYERRIIQRYAGSAGGFKISYSNNAWDDCDNYL